MNKNTKLPIVPKGLLTKIWAAILVLVTSPGLFKAVTQTAETFSDAAQQSGGSLAVAWAGLIASLGVIYGIARRLWI